MNWETSLRLAATALVLALAGSCCSTVLAQEATRGPQLGLASGFFVPPEGGRLGFAIAGDARYGFALGRATLAPGFRLAGFFRSGLAVAAPLAGARLDYALGIAHPFVVGAVGLGHASDRSRQGVAYQAAAGVLLDLGTRWSLGAEASYLAITGSDFRALSLGPCLTLHL